MQQIYALRRGRFASQVLMTLSLLGVSLPTFLIGILLILVFAVILKWLPSFGRGEVVALGSWTTGFLTVDGWRHLILPGITLAVFQLTCRSERVRKMMTSMASSATDASNATPFRPAASCSFSRTCARA